MSDLEELGYLAQPHTSAGRIPSNKAYRLYVDHLVQMNGISENEKTRINQYMQDRSRQIEEMIRGAANVLSDATQYTSVIVAPQIQTLKIRRVQLVPVTEMLTGQLADHTLSEVRQIFAQLFRDLSTHRRLLGGVMKAMEDKLIEDAPEDVVVGGPTKMLNYPEYSDVEKAKNFLTIFESKDRLAQIMKHSGGMEVTIRIGPENEIEELKDCSLVTATYRVGNHGTGTLGIIGPTRMNYQRVVTVMDYMGQVISRLLSGDIDEK